MLCPQQTQLPASPPFRRPPKIRRNPATPDATAPTRIGYCGARPASIPPPKHSSADPKTRTECATPNIRPCESTEAVFDSSADMFVVPIAMQAPINGSRKHNHCHCDGVIMNTKSSPSEIALAVVMIRGAQRLPMGLISNHCVQTMETLV